MRILFLALLLTAGVPAAASPGQDDALDRIVLLQTGSDAEKVQAARWLGLHLVQDARDALELAAGAPDDELRTVARLMLRLLHEPELLELPDAEAVVRGLDDRDPARRVVALQQAPYFGTTDALPRIVALLADDDAEVRAEAITAVSYVDTDDAHREAVLELLDDPHASVETRLMSYLWGHKDPDLVAFLAAKTAHPKYAASAVRTLRSWGFTEPTVKALLGLVANATDRQAITLYLTALEQLAPERPATPAWSSTLDALLDHPDEATRQQVARLLLRSGHSRARPVLMEGLRSADPRIRQDAARTLASAGVQVERRLISGLLEDPEIEVRRAALELAGNLAPARARTILRRVLRQPGREADLQTKALLLLQAVGDEEDVEAIIELSRRTSSDFVAVNALLALGVLEGRIGSRRSLPYLRQVLEDPQAGDGRVSAIGTALQHIGDPSFLPLLSRRLRQCPAPCWLLAPELSSAISILLGRQLHGPTFARQGDGP